MDTIAELVREGMPVVPAIGLALVPPEQLRERARVGHG